MFLLSTFKPSGTSDSSVTITASSEKTSYEASKLKDIRPAYCWKSNNVVTNSWVKYNFGSATPIGHVFLNRFNFASFKIQASSDDSNWTDILTVTDACRDELTDENYMRYWCALTGFNHQYMRLYIPTQTPLFEATYFKLGNMLVGNAVEIWNPKPGYSMNGRPMVNVIEFTSGYMEDYKVGRAKRVFSGEFDHITNAEFLKIIFTRNPVVVYHDWVTDPEQYGAYLVKELSGYNRNYNYATIVNRPVEWMEMV